MNWDNTYQTSVNAGITDTELRDFMINIYKHVIFSLLITGIAAVLGTMPPLVNFIYQIHNNQIVALSTFGSILRFAPLIMIIYFHFTKDNMSSDYARTFLWSFSAVMGLSLSILLMIYTGESIFSAFFITAGSFGTMSIYGYTTKRDLTAMGTIMIMSLIGIIFASLANMFIGSSGLEFVITILGIIVFMVMIAWETQSFKNLFLLHRNTMDTDKIAILAALQLYMSFINLFIYILRLTGDRRR